MRQVWVDSQKCLGCKSCELACAVERNSVTKNLAGAVLESPKPMPRVGVYGPSGSSFPIQCRHCQDAACLKACPSGAMQRDSDSGLTVVDQVKCRACWMCVMSCPFGAVSPHRGYKVAHKCDACKDMEAPACVAACPTKALIYGEERDYDKLRVTRSVLLSVQIRKAAVSRVPFGLDYVREDE